MIITQRRDERGQILVIVAGILVVLVALVGLVIDGGYAWGQQRQTQNAADAASEAGAVQLAENVAGVSPARTDADVLSAVNASGSSNGIGNPVACYVNDAGQVIDSAGAATGNQDCGGAAMVGGGTIPPNAAGVTAEGSRTFNTFIMRVVGFDQLTTTARATAKAGYVTSSCDASAGCVILPLTVPVTTVTCDGSGNPIQTTDPYQLDTLYIIPLCKNGPGNVGWIDWTPTAGGTSELIDSILNPDNPPLKWPGWYYITATGNVNSAGVEDALNTYDGQTVSFPQFDATCDATPTGPGINDCPAGHLGGNGSNQWYHLATMVSFVFCGPSSGNDPDCAGHTPAINNGAYISGSDKPICDTGNGATSCIAGKFKVISTSGEVSGNPPPNCDKTKPDYDPAKCLSDVGVQLIH